MLQNALWVYQKSVTLETGLSSLCAVIVQVTDLLHSLLTESLLFSSLRENNGHFAGTLWASTIKPKGQIKNGAFLKQKVCQHIIQHN